MGTGDGHAPSWWNLAPLVFGAFVVAAEGTILTGVLPALSADLSASAGAVGQALATYPLVYVVGAPLLAVVVGGRSQPNACALGLGVFAVGNLISASAGALVVLMLGRLVSALGACVFIPNASARAVTLGTRRRGRALSVMSSGFTAATLVGAPLGVYSAALVCWRWVLVVVAGAALLAAAVQRLGSLGDNPVSGMEGLAAAFGQELPVEVVEVVGALVGPRGQQRTPVQRTVVTATCMNLDSADLVAHTVNKPQ